MHCLVEGEASSIRIPNPGSRTAGTLSLFYPFPALLLVAWPGALQKRLLKWVDNLRTGQDRHTIVWELDSSRSMERKFGFLLH